MNSEHGAKLILMQPKPPKRRRKLPLKEATKNELFPKKKNWMMKFPLPNLRKLKLPMMSGKLNKKKKTNLNSISEDLVKVKMTRDGEQ